MTIPSLSAVHIVRERQCRLLGRDYSATDRRATDTLYNSACLALSDIASNKTSVSFRVCSMPTGYGKSNSAIAFMVAAAAADPEFSAVYVCKERRFAEQTADLIDALSAQVIGRPLSLVYTAAHADRHNRATERRWFEEHYNDFVPSISRPVVRKEDLQHARIIVVTHKSWLSEIESDGDTGVRFFKGRRRLSFVDEQPEMVNIIEVSPSEVQAFHDRMVRSSTGTDLSDRLARIVGAMNDVMQATGDDFSVPNVIEEDDALLFAMLRWEPREHLSPFVTPGAIPTEAARELEFHGPRVSLHHRSVEYGCVLQPPRQDILEL